MTLTNTLLKGYKKITHRYRVITATGHTICLSHFGSKILDLTLNEISEPVISPGHSFYGRSKWNNISSISEGI